MGKKIERNRSKTLPSSPTHSFSSSSSSDFEFRISISPRKSSAELCPADELFYKGKLLPLHTSPRISMVRTLLLASSSTSSSSDTTTTASRDSSSSTDSTSSSFAADLSLLDAGDPCSDSARPSSVTDDDNKDILNHNSCINRPTNKKFSTTGSNSSASKYFSLSRISNVFKKDNITSVSQKEKITSSNSKKIHSSAKDVIRKYLKKVKPLYEKLSSKHQQGRSPCVGGSSLLQTTSSGPLRATSTDILLKGIPERSTQGGPTGPGTKSFSGNSKSIKRGYVASCPSSMRSSPNHSGVLTRAGLPAARRGVASTSTQGSCSYSSDASTMEELQNAIQGAIAHCKSSMIQSTSCSFNNNNDDNNNNNNL